MLCLENADIMNERKKYSDISLDGMLPLDMLAEVASETLRCDLALGFSSDFRKNSNGVVKSSQKRSATSNDFLTLDQIRVLSDKMLLEMFSESSSDEIRRTFSYRCYLMPENCDENFSSFGSETKARLQMKSHLLTHVSQLLAAAKSQGAKYENQFVAEPLNVRKKRLQETSPKRRKKVRNLSRSKTILSKNLHKRKTITTSPKPSKKTDRRLNGINKLSRLVSDQAMAANLFVSKAHNRLKKSHVNYSTKEKQASYKELPPSFEDLFLAIQKVGSSVSDVQQDISIINKSTALREEKRTTFRSLDSLKCPASTKDSTLLNNVCTKISKMCLEPSLLSENLPVEEKSVICNVKLLNTSIDPSSFMQHDHTYTSINGKTFDSDTCDSAKTLVKSVKEKRRLPHKCSGIAFQLIIPTPPFPYIYEPLLPHISEIKEISNSSRRLCDKCTSVITPSGCFLKKNNSFQKSTCTNKQSRFRRINKLVIPEEMEPDTEDDENIPMVFMSNFSEDGLSEPVITEDISAEQVLIPLPGETNGSDTPHLGERKLALKCIRALRMKKKDERGPLVCQICNGKSFTAQATLMYHYRSHAGIKPFTCSVCDATFTRQHSLNYHMLIHNNKSRFVCDECGRSFRHPSHYKEHLRRHTGETPFQCSDCSLRFKTRNTYKRHLKTRHGKILSARGIRVLSVEEFDKVRTMPRRRSSKQPVLPEESQWSNLTFSQLPDVKSEILDS